MSISLESPVPDTRNTTLFFTTPSPTQLSATSTHDLLPRPADTDDHTSHLTFYPTLCPELADVRPESSDQPDDISSLNVGNLQSKSQVVRPLVDTSARIEDTPDIVVNLPTPVGAAIERPISFEIRSSQVRVQGRSVEETITVLKRGGESKIVRESKTTEKDVSTPQPLIKQLSDLRISEMLENEASPTASNVEESIPIISLPDEEQKASNIPKERFIPIQLEDQPGVFVISPEVPSKTTVSIEEMETSYPDEIPMPITSNKVSDDNIPSGQSTAILEQFPWIVQPLVGQEAQDIVGEYDVSSVEVVPPDEAHRRTSVIVCTGSPVLVTEETSPIREVQTSQATVRVTPKLKRVSESSEQHELVNYPAPDAPQSVEEISTETTVPQANEFRKEMTQLEDKRDEHSKLPHKSGESHLELSKESALDSSDSVENEPIPEHKVALDIPTPSGVTTIEIMQTHPAGKEKEQIERSSRRRKGPGIYKTSVEVPQETTSPTDSLEEISLSGDDESVTVDSTIPEILVETIDQVVKLTPKRSERSRARTGVKNTIEDRIDVQLSSASDKESSVYEDGTVKTTFEAVVKPNQVPEAEKSWMDVPLNTSPTEKESVSISLKQTTRRKIRTRSSSKKKYSDSTSSSDKEGSDHEHETQMQSVCVVSTLKKAIVAQETFVTEFHGLEQTDVTDEAEKGEKRGFIKKRPKQRNLNVRSDKWISGKGSDSGSSLEPESETYRTEEQLKIERLDKTSAISVHVSEVSNEQSIPSASTLELDEMLESKDEKPDAHFVEALRSIEKKQKAKTQINLSPQLVILQQPAAEEAPESKSEQTVSSEIQLGSIPSVMQVVIDDVVEISELKNERKTKKKKNTATESVAAIEVPSEDKMNTTIIYRETESDDLPHETVEMTTEPTWPTPKNEFSPSAIAEIGQPSEKDVPVRSQETIKLEGTETAEVTPTTTKPLKKAKALPKRELASFQVEKVTLKPVKKQGAPRQDKDASPKEVSAMKLETIARDDLSEDKKELMSSDVVIELKKRSHLTKSLGKEQVPEGPEETPSQQQYDIEAVAETLPSELMEDTISRKIEEVFIQNQESSSPTSDEKTEILSVKTDVVQPFSAETEIHQTSAFTPDEKPTISDDLVDKKEKIKQMTTEQLEIVEALESPESVSAQQSSDIICKIDNVVEEKKQRTTKTEISVDSSVIAVEQCKNESEFKTELTLPVDIQPTEPTVVPSVEVVQHVVPGPQSKKKPRPKKTEISLARVEEPSTAEQLKFTSQLTFPSDSQQKESTPLIPESFQKVEDVSKTREVELEIKVKPRREQTDIDITSKFITDVQREAAQAPHFKSEVPSNTETPTSRMRESIDVVPSVEKDIDVDNKPKIVKTHISFMSESSIEQQSATTKPLNVQTDLTLPTGTQQQEPLEPTSVSASRVLTLKDIRGEKVKVKSKINMAPEAFATMQPEIALALPSEPEKLTARMPESIEVIPGVSLASEVVIVNQPEKTVELKSEVNLEPEQVTSVKTESVLVVQDVVKEVLEEKKPKSSEPVKLKTEVKFPSKTEPDTPLAVTTPLPSAQVTDVKDVGAKKKPKVKVEASLAPVTVKPKIPEFKSELAFPSESEGLTGVPMELITRAQDADKEVKLKKKPKMKKTAICFARESVVVDTHIETTEPLLLKSEPTPATRLDTTTVATELYTLEDVDLEQKIMKKKMEIVKSEMLDEKPAGRAQETTFFKVEQVESPEKQLETQVSSKQLGETTNLDIEEDKSYLSENKLEITLPKGQKEIDEKLPLPDSAELEKKTVKGISVEINSKRRDSRTEQVPIIDEIPAVIPTVFQLENEKEPSKSLNMSFEPPLQPLDVSEVQKEPIDAVVKESVFQDVVIESRLKTGEPVKEEHHEVSVQLDFKSELRLHSDSQPEAYTPALVESPHAVEDVVIMAKISKTKIDFEPTHITCERTETAEPKELKSELTPSSEIQPEVITKTIETEESHAPEAQVEKKIKKKKKCINLLVRDGDKQPTETDQETESLPVDTVTSGIQSPVDIIVEELKDITVKNKEDQPLISQEAEKCEIPAQGDELDALMVPLVLTSPKRPRKMKTLPKLETKALDQPENKEVGEIKNAEEVETTVVSQPSGRLEIDTPAETDRQPKTKETSPAKAETLPREMPDQIENSNIVPSITEDTSVNQITQRHRSSIDLVPNPQNKNSTAELTLPGETVGDEDDCSHQAEFEFSVIFPKTPHVETSEFESEVASFTISQNVKKPGDIPKTESWTAKEQNGEQWNAIECTVDLRLGPREIPQELNSFEIGKKVEEPIMPDATAAEVNRVQAQLDLIETDIITSEDVEETIVQTKDAGIKDSSTPAVVFDTSQKSGVRRKKNLKGKVNKDKTQLEEPTKALSELNIAKSEEGLQSPVDEDAYVSITTWVTGEKEDEQAAISKETVEAPIVEDLFLSKTTWVTGEEEGEEKPSELEKFSISLPSYPNQDVNEGVQSEEQVEHPEICVSLGRIANWSGKTVETKADSDGGADASFLFKPFIAAPQTLNSAEKVISDLKETETCVPGENREGQKPNESKSPVEETVIELQKVPLNPEILPEIHAAFEIKLHPNVSRTEKEMPITPESGKTDVVVAATFTATRPVPTETRDGSDYSTSPVVTETITLTFQPDQVDFRQEFAEKLTATKGIDVLESSLDDVLAEKNFTVTENIEIPFKTDDGEIPEREEIIRPQVPVELDVLTPNAESFISAEERPEQKETPAASDVSVVHDRKKSQKKTIKAKKTLVSTEALKSPESKDTQEMHFPLASSVSSAEANESSFSTLLLGGPKDVKEKRFQTGIDLQREPFPETPNVDGDRSEAQSSNEPSVPSKTLKEIKLADEGKSVIDVSSTRSMSDVPWRRKSNFIPARKGQVVDEETGSEKKSVSVSLEEPTSSTLSPQTAGMSSTMTVLQPIPLKEKILSQLGSVENLVTEESVELIGSDEGLLKTTATPFTHSHEENTIAIMPDAETTHWRQYEADRWIPTTEDTVEMEVEALAKDCVEIPIVEPLVPEHVEKTVPEVDIPDVEPSAIATLEHSGDNLPEKNIAKKKKTLRFAETSLQPSPTSPLIPQSPKDLVSQAQPLAEEGTVTTEKSSETVELKMKKVKQSIRMDAEVRPSSRSDVKPKDKLPVVIQSTKRDGSLEILPTQIVGMTVEPTKVNIETSDTSVSEVMQRPAPEEEVPLKSQDSLCLEPVRKTELEMTPETSKPLKKTRSLPKRELATFEVEKVTLKPVKKIVVEQKKDEHPDRAEMPGVKQNSPSREELPEEQVDLKKVDAAIELKKKRVVIKSSVPEQPETSPFQQEYHVESILKEAPVPVQPETVKISETKMTPENVVFVQSETVESFEPKPERAVQGAVTQQEPIALKIESTQAVESTINVRELEIKKKPETKKTQINLTSEADTTELSEFKTELALPSDIQPQEPQHVKDVTTVEEIQIKKKPKPRKTEIGLASESVSSEKPEVVEPLELKSEVKLPSQPEEVMSATTESVQVAQDVAKEVEKKKKPRTLKTKTSLAPESITAEQPDTTESLRLKTELTMAPRTEPEVATTVTSAEETVLKHVVAEKIPQSKTEISLKPKTVLVHKPETVEEFKSEVTLQPEELATVKTEATQVVQEAAKDIVLKKKAKTQKTEVSLAPESVPIEQVETTEPLELKSELTFPSDIQPEPLSTTEMQQVSVIQDMSPKKDVKKKRTKLVIADEERPVASPRETESLQVELVKPSDIQQETQLESTAEKKIHQSGATMDTLSKPKSPKTIIKKVSIQETVQPIVVESKAISIETKSVKRAVQTETAPVIESQSVTSISLQPKEEDKDLEVSTVPEQPKQPFQVTEAKIEPVVEENQDVVVQTKMKIKKTRRVSDNDSKESSPVAVTRASMHIDEEVSQSPSVTRLEQPEEPREVSETAAETGVIQDAPILKKTKKRTVKTVEQSSSQKETVELPVELCELAEQPDEPLKQTETTRIELKRPKEPKSTETAVPESKKFVQPIVQEMSIESKSTKRDVPSEVSTITLEQPKYSTEKVNVDIPQSATVTQEFTIQSKSEKIVQPSETFNISLSSKVSETETAQTEDSTIIKKTKETSVKRKSKKVSREHREATPVAPLVPAGFSEVASPALEQVMLDERPTLTAEYAELRLPETQKATLVQQAVAFDSSGDFTAGKSPFSASAKPKLDIQEGLQCQEVQVIPFQTAIVPKKAESVSASIEMMSSFPLEVGEVQVFNKPEKYMPALFVATEKARPRLTTESALITTETRPPEREGSYTAARLPPTQQANVALSLRESASIAQARLHESESHLRFDRPQESATAAMEPVSSLVAIVNKQETQLSAEELIQRPESIKQKGKMSVIPHESLVRDEPQTTEREISGIVKLPTSATERAEPVMVTSRSLSVHTQQPYQSGDLPELTSAIPACKTAKKVQDINETISSHQVVIDETTGDVEETKTPAGQAATAGCVALESAATTQKMTYESEGNWTETARLPSIPAPKSTMETFTVAQTGSTMIVDKESSLELPILPESNQASSRLESFLTTAATATVNTLQSAEPFAQAAVVSEKPKVVGSSGQSLPSIQQVYVEEAAAKFSPQMKPEAKQAVQVLDEENGQTSAQTGETWTQESAMDTLPESATTDQAHVSLQPHLAVVQLSVVPSSAGDVFKKEETPTLQSARADLVPLQGIASAQQIPSHEREGQILSPPTIPTLRASLSVQNPMESSVTQEIQTSFKEQVLPQFNRPELDTASCSVSGDSRSMLPVTVEVGSDECLASYVAVPVPTAESRLIHEVQQSVRVTANETVEREVEFVSDTLPKQQTITQTAHLVTSGSVVTSEVRPEQMPNTFQQAISDVIPQASQACCILARPTIHPLTLTETATSESLAPMQTQRPVESKAALELPQQQSLLVSQHQLIEQEAIRSQQTAPQKQQVNVKLTTREAIVTDHQQQVQHGSDYHVPKPTTVSLEAKIVPSNQGKAAQVTETQTGSFAGQFQTADQIRETAQLSLSSMETATVSHVWDYRKEADWVPTSAQPAKKTAQAVASSELRSVQVEQTQTVEAGGQLDVTEALMADSTSSITPLLEMSSLYSAQIFQKEKPLEQFVRGQSQSARPVAPSERRTVQVSQVQTSIHESPLDIVRPVEQTAKSSLPQSEVAVKTEDVVMDYCVPQKQLAMETATPNVSFTEQRAVSVGHVIESGIQSSLSADSRPEEKTAIRSIPEHVQMGVASVQVAYKEGLLDDFVTAQSQRAKSMTDEQRTVLVSEVQPQVSEVPLENQTMSGKFAQSSQVIQEAPVTQEVTVMDFTTQKSMDNLVEERPTVNITEQLAVSVQQVVEGSTATELVPDVKKKSKKATRAQIERTEISVGDVQLAFKEAPLEEFSAGQPQSARWVKEEQRTVQISQVQTEMKEEPLEIVKPTSKTAMASVPEKQTVVISQDVLMDFTLPQTAKVVDSVTPVVNVAEHRAVSVAQVVEASSESQLVPEFKPKSKKANRHLPEKTETTVFQVETVDKEAPIEAFVAVHSQLANVSADEQRTVHVTQVVSEMKEVPLESQMPLGRKAKMDVQEAIARTTQEQLPLDVTILHKSRPTETETAFVVHPEKKALSVSTVVESSTESEMAPSVQPERKTAKASVSQSEAIFSSQNLLMDTIEPQTEEKAELEKPVVRMTEQLAVNVGQVVESSTEVELVPQVKKKTKKATRVLPEKNVTSVQDVDVSFKEAPLDEFVQGPVQSATVSAPEEKRTIQVAEIQTSVSAAPLAVTRRPSAETVRARLPENQAAVQQETVAMDFTVPKAEATVIEELPNVSVIEHKAVSIDQVVEGSTGAELVPEIKKKTKKATRVLPQKTETSVSDVQVAFKEVPMQDFTVGQSQTAVAVMDESKTLEISQAQSSIREEVLEIEKPKRGTAKSRLPEAETVVVSENVVMDFAAPQTVAETEKPIVTVQEQKAVSVSHVVEASSESELVAEAKPKSRKASRSLPQRSEEIGVAQVELTETLSDLDRLPAAVQASSRDIPLVKETADVTEQVVNIAPEEDVSFSDDSFQSLASSSSTLIEDTMMTAASSLEDLVEEVQLPVVIQEEIEDVEASFQLPSPKDEDTISQEFSIGLKPKSEPVVESEDVQATVKLAEDVVDVSASKKIIKKKKKKVVEEDVEESVTIQATKSEEQLVESAAVFKLKQQVMHDTPWQDVEEEYVFKKETEADEEESANLTIKKSVKSKPYQVEEVEDVVNLASIRKVEPVAVEDVEKAATLKLKPVKVVVEQEDVEEQFKLGLKPVKPKERTDDVEHEMTIKPKGQPRQVVDAEDVVLKMVQKQEVPYRVEEIEDELQVKPILKKKKKVVDDTVESGATFKLKETVAVDDAEDVEQQFQIGLKPKRKSKVQIQTVEDEAAFSLKRPAKSVVVIQEASEAASLVIQQPADDDSVSTAERTSQSISQQFTDSGVVSITDVIIQPKKTKKPYRVEDVEDAFAVQARKVKDSAEGDDVEGGAIFKLKSQGETSEDVQEEFSLGLKPRRPVKPSISVEADESLRFKIPARPKVSAPTLVEDGNTLTVTRAATSVLADTEEETTCPLEPQEGDEFFSLCSYVADTEEAMNLVEGERVYVLEWHNSDWWFVRKHLTEETGWVPAQYLKDDTSYTHYVKKKLDEKINKLPVFDLPSTDESKVQAPRFLTKLQPIRAPDGTSVTFECQVEGSPRPVITWFRQTAVIKPSQDFQMVYDEEGNLASLTIVEVFPEDAGTFTCVAKNSAGFASSSTELVVEAPLSDHGSDTTITSRRSLSRESSLMDILEGIPPTFSQRPKTKTVDEGTDVELECRLVAVPEPDVAWFHNGKRIKPSDRIALLGQSDVHMYCSIIQIKDVQMTDEGTYDIIARNREGEAVSHVVLNVKVKGAKKMPPQVDQPLKNAVVQIGSSVTLTAKVTGIPSPVVKWYRNGVEIQTNVTTNERGVSTLIVPAAQPEDDGDYMLNAENEHGQVQTSATLTVQPPSKLHFVEKFSHVSVLEGDPFVLKATLSAPAEVSWYRNGKRLKPTKSLKITSDGLVHTLQVSSASVDKEIGEYKCVASATGGTKISHAAHVTVECNIFVQPLADVEVDAGSDVVLLCRTKEPAEVFWYRDDILLAPLLPSGQQGPVQESRDREHKLVMRRVGRKETGRYSCTFHNQTTACVFTVRAEPAHEFVTKIKDLEIKERQPAVFTADVSDDAAQVTWHKDGEPLDQANTERYEFVAEARKRSFTIRSVSLLDEGEYTCSLADQECTAELVVIELPPEITLRLQDVTVRRGEEASFEIELTKGDAKIQWFRNNEEIQLSEHIQLAIDGKRQRLVIYDSGPEDACEYSCVIGDQKSAARLQVLAPKVNFVAKLPEIVAAPMGQDVTFTVQLTGEDAEVTWMKNGEVVVDSDRIKRK